MSLIAKPNHRHPHRVSLLAAAAVLGSLWLSLAWCENPPIADAGGSQKEATQAKPTAEQIQVAIAEAAKRSAAAFQPAAGVPQSVKDKWGVEVIRIDSSAGGYWLDFRFKVTDVAKSLPLFDSRIKPYTESEKSGLKLGVPTAAKVGSLRTTNRGGNIKAGKIYNMIFGNVGAQIKPGDKVAVVVGDFKVEHLTVN